MQLYDTSTTQGKIQVMQAAKDGKPLQRKHRSWDLAWRDQSVGDEWDWLNFDYRIKPNPREWCIYIDPDTALPRWVPWHAGMAGMGVRVREVVEV